MYVVITLGHFSGKRWEESAERSKLVVGKYWEQCEMIKIEHFKFILDHFGGKMGKGTEQPKLGVLNDFIPFW